MRKGYVLIISLMILSIFLTGCMGGGTKAQDTPTSYVPTGTQGLVLSFLPDQPPAKIYTGAPLVLLAEVRNKGYADITTAELSLTGYDPGVLDIKGANSRISVLEGTSYYNKEGDFTTFEFIDDRVSLQKGVPMYMPNFLLTACYAYETVASPIVCVDPEPHNTLIDKSCTVGSINTGGSQGAPIAITAINAQATPTQMVFEITISNSGGGQVYESSFVNKCTSNTLSYSDLGKVNYDAITLGNSKQPLDCKPKNVVRLVNGNGKLYCTYPQQGGTAYETPLNMHLTYGYRTSITKKVEIQNLEE